MNGKERKSGLGRTERQVPLRSRDGQAQSYEVRGMLISQFIYNVNIPHRLSSGHLLNGVNIFILRVG